MIKMLLDQGLPRTAASLLRERGWVGGKGVGKLDLAMAGNIEPSQAGPRAGLGLGKTAICY